MAEQSNTEQFGKVPIVTGASRGIGAAIAERLAHKRCSVVVNHSGPRSAALKRRRGGVRGR